MHTAKSLKAKKKKKSYCISIHQRKLQKIYILYFSMHFGFNNQFIKVMRTWPIFQKKKKICFVLIPGIMNLYVKCIPNIKKIIFFL